MGKNKKGTGQKAESKSGIVPIDVSIQKLYNSICDTTKGPENIADKLSLLYLCDAINKKRKVFVTASQWLLTNKEVFKEKFGIKVTDDVEELYKEIYA